MPLRPCAGPPRGGHGPGLGVRRTVAPFSRHKSAARQQRIPAPLSAAVTAQMPSGVHEPPAGVRLTASPHLASACRTAAGYADWLPPPADVTSADWRNRGARGVFRTCLTEARAAAPGCPTVEQAEDGARRGDFGDQSERGREAVRAGPVAGGPSRRYPQLLEARSRSQ